MRRIYRRDPVTGRMYEVGAEERERSHEVMPDLAPYRNVIDGKVIGGRRQHREFLKRHGVQEVGNERPQVEPWQPDRQSINDSVREAMRQLEWNEAPRLEQLHDMRDKAMKDMGLE